MLRKDMQKAMQNNAAVFRTQSSLQEGVQQIDAIADRVRGPVLLQAVVVYLF